MCPGGVLVVQPRDAPAAAAAACEGGLPVRPRDLGGHGAVQAGQGHHHRRVQPQHHPQ